jgi:transcription elongation factor Elf1
VRGARKKSGKDKEMLTEEQKTKYLPSPYLCPFCGSAELTLGKVTADINRAMQSISCGECKRRWTNVYALTQVVEDDWDMRKGEIKPKREE